MQTMESILVSLHLQVFAWLRERNIPPSGPPFWKNNVIDMDRLLEVEVGVPVAASVDGDEKVLAGVLLSGGYATLRYTGHPDCVISAVASLREWAGQEGPTLDMTDTPGGERWAARLEIFETYPAVEPARHDQVDNVAGFPPGRLVPGRPLPVIGGQGGPAMVRVSHFASAPRRVGSRDAMEQGAEVR
jgi:hypothetical protein